MAVMSFHHARIDVAEIPRHDVQRHAGHDAQAGVAVPRRVKADLRVDPRRSNGGGHRPQLLGPAPCRAIRLGQHDLVAGAAYRQLLEESRALFGEMDVPRLPAFRLQDGNRVAVRAEVPHLQPGEFAIAGTRYESGLHQFAEVLPARVDEPTRLVDAEEPLSRRVDLADWLEAAPRLGVLGSHLVARRCVKFLATNARRHLGYLGQPPLEALGAESFNQLRAERG